MLDVWLWVLGSVLVLLVVALAGGVGWLIGFSRGRRPIPTSQQTPAALQPTVEAVVPAGMSQVIAVLRSSAIVVGPHDEVLLSSSQARTFGLVRGTRLSVPLLLDLVREVRRDGRIRTAELELRRGAPILFLSARVARVGELVLVLAEDRTAARRVEETRRDFVANISHELKTPIGAIQLLAEAVEDAADDPEAVRAFATRMGRESRRLTALVTQLIELSRLQSDDPLHSAEEVDLDGVLVEAVERCGERARAREVSLVIAGDHGCVINGDEEQLTTAVSNLITNAINYSEPQRRVTAAVRRTSDTDGQFVEISVSDSGVGIAAKDVPRIFERFYRVDYARSRDDGGTGLGLAIVKHIAATHGGTVSVWSKPGQGSTFTIRLPEAVDEVRQSLRPEGLGTELAGNDPLEAPALENPPTGTSPGTPTTDTPAQTAATDREGRP